MICFNDKHSQILSRVNLSKISTLLNYAPDRTKEVFFMIIPQETDSVLFFKSFISSMVINNSTAFNRSKKLLWYQPVVS